MIKVKAFLKGQSSSSSGSGGSDVESSVATSNNNKNGFVVIDKQNGNSRTSNEELIESTDELFLQLRSEAIQVVKNEPMLFGLLSKVGLLDNTTLASIPTTTTKSSSACNTSPAKTFEEVISRIVAHRLSSCSGGSEGNVCPQLLLHGIHESFKSTELELGHTMSEAVRADAVAVVRRDPACETLLEVVLFMKGFASLVIHRAARRAWKPNNNNSDEGGAGASARFSALLLQSLASSAFGVDIHPAAEIGAGVMFDHASGIVIGETAVIGDGTTILHGVTLGGTGKENGDRHPKVGQDVLIGAGTKILGNIRIGDRVKIGAGSVVLRPIPTGATAVGAPARIIGFTPKGEKPGSFVDSRLGEIEPLSGVADSLVGTTITKSTTDTSLSTATTEMQAISEGQLESSSSDVMEGSDGDDDSGEKIMVTPKKKNVSNGPIKPEEPDEKDDEKDEEEDDGDDEDDKTKDDDMCPFSGTFKKCPRALSEDWISHPKLRSLLTQKGCSESECIEVFFELLHLLPPDSKARLCGCIPADVFAKNIVTIAQEKTALDLETCQALANGDLLVLGLNKKASKRFKCFFVKVAKNSARALSRISSASDLLSSSRRESILGNDSERATT